MSEEFRHARHTADKDTNGQFGPRAYGYLIGEVADVRGLGNSEAVTCAYDRDYAGTVVIQKISNWS